MRVQTVNLSQAKVTPTLLAGAFAVDIRNGRAKLYFWEAGDTVRGIRETLTSKLGMSKREACRFVTSRR